MVIAIARFGRAQRGVQAALEAGVGEETFDYVERLARTAATLHGYAAKDFGARLIELGRLRRGR